jgi:HSP20 family protein
MALAPFTRLLGQDLARAFALLEEPFLSNARRFPASFPATIRPSVDVSETDTNYIVEAEVPGIKKEDLQVEFLDDGTLILKGKIERTRQESDVSEDLRTVDQTGKPQEESLVASEEKSLSSPTYWSNERHIGSFQRSFQFPGRIDPPNVKARYRDGILSIFVPKVKREGVKVNIEES